MRKPILSKNDFNSILNLNLIVIEKQKIIILFYLISILIGYVLLRIEINQIQNFVYDYQWYFIQFSVITMIAIFSSRIIINFKVLIEKIMIKISTNNPENKNIE